MAPGSTVRSGTSTAGRRCVTEAGTAPRLSNKWDTRIGGVLADAIGSNAVVKAFAGEAREDALLLKLDLKAGPGVVASPC